MKNSKGFIQIIVIILVVLAIIAGVYYFGTKNKSIPTPVASVQPFPSPVATSDPTANWKTYVNTKVGFQIMYPTTGFSKPQLPSGVANSPEVYADENTDNNDIFFSNSAPSLEVFEFSGGLDELISYYMAGKAPMFAPAAAEVVTSTEMLQVDGVQAKRYETRPKIVYPETENDRSRFVYFVGHNHGFVLVGGTQSQEDQILSTFKFTN